MQRFTSVVPARPNGTTPRTKVDHPPTLEHPRRQAAGDAQATTTDGLSSQSHFADDEDPR